MRKSDALGGNIVTKRFLYLIYLVVIIFSLCSLSGCGLLYDASFVRENHTVASPSGEYIAEQENFIGPNDTRLYVIHINNRLRNDK
jgi:hypothetical protein